MKSIIKWLGSKNKLLPIIKENMPLEYNKYIEPFFGSGTLFFNLQPEKAVINDINENIISLFKIVKDENEKDKLYNEIKKLDEQYYKLPFEKRKEYFFSIRDLFNTMTEPDIKKITLFVFLTNRCFNGIFKINKHGKCIVGFGEIKNAKRKNTIDKDKLDEMSKYLYENDILILNKDFNDIIEFSKENDFVYLDPPYVKNDKNSFTMYSKNDFGKEDNNRLYEMFKYLDNKKVKILMHNHNTDEIREKYKEWTIIPLKVNRFMSGRKNMKKMDYYNEVLIKNF